MLGWAQGAGGWRAGSVTDQVKPSPARARGSEDFPDSSQELGHPPQSCSGLPALGSASLYPEAFVASQSEWGNPTWWGWWGQAPV